jgi:hypothetical protein
MDKADRQVFPVGCHWNACSHRDEFFFFMRNELIVPTDGVKLLEQFSPRWMRVIQGLQDLQFATKERQSQIGVKFKTA